MCRHRFLLLAGLLASSTAAISLAAFAFQQSEEPAVVQAVAPYYPPIARAAKAAGEVRVQVKIDSSGKVKSSQVMQGHPLLKEAAAAAAQQWLFTSNLQTSKREALLKFNFVLLPPAKTTKQLTTSFRLPYEVEIIREEPEVIVHSDPPGYEVKTKAKRK